MTTVRSSNAKSRPTVNVLAKPVEIDEYGILYYVDGKLQNAYSTLVLTETSKGKPYARIQDANPFSKSAVVRLSGIPMDIRIVGMSKGVVVKVFGTVHGKLGRDDAEAIAKYQRESVKQTFVTFTGLLDEPMPNNIYRVNGIRLRKAEAGFSVHANFHHAITSFKQAALASGGNVSKTMLDTDANADLATL